MSDIGGWRVEARPAPAALAEGFPRADYVTPEPLHAGRDWVSLEEKLDVAGWALLMKYAAIGDPNGTVHTG
jgi:hypothetical protein